MKWISLAVCVGAGLGAGCKKAVDKLESQATKTSDTAPAASAGPYSDGGNPSVSGAAQGVRKAADRVVTDNELKQLHLFILNAQDPESGRLPDSTVTYGVIYKEDRKLYNLIKDGLVVLTPNPTPDGAWAYVKEAPTTGGFVVTRQGVETMTAAQFQALPK